MITMTTRYEVQQKARTVEDGNDWYPAAHPLLVSPDRLDFDLALKVAHMLTNDVFEARIVKYLTSTVIKTEAEVTWRSAEK